MDSLITELLEKIKAGEQSVEGALKALWAKAQSVFSSDKAYVEAEAKVVEADAKADAAVVEADAKTVEADVAAGIKKVEGEI